MYKISQHPILDIPVEDTVAFLYQGHLIEGQRGHTIAAALHRAGYPVHSHSLDGRGRSLGCGIGKCGACEMLVDGRIRRICITPVDGVKEVREIPRDYQLTAAKNDGGNVGRTTPVYRTTVAIIGAGPAGLACREQLRAFGIPCLVIDNNATPGGQFNMQTHQFFFFEKEKKFGGMRGFDIAKKLVGDNHDDILLNTTVWDLLEGRRLALKNIVTQQVCYVDADYLVVACGAVPFMPAFQNDDIPGVYTAAVFQKMMNQEHTLLGKRVLTVGAGNIGYLTSYQAIQAGACVHAIVEGMEQAGGFPVQANRVRRMGIPILTGTVLIKAIPNADHTGVAGAVVAQCRDFRPIPGTERIIDDIDIINICTGLIPDSQLLTKGREVFGYRVFGAGDAVRIGEGTSAVLCGRLAAYEVARDMGVRYDYNEYLDVSRQHIDSQQRPVRILDEAREPDAQRRKLRPYVVANCLYGFACNPCTFACPQGAISKLTTSGVPVVDYEKCVGCTQCVSRCPGLAIFGYDEKQGEAFLPVEYDVQEDTDVWLVDDNGNRVGEGIIRHLQKKPNKTDVACVKVQVADVSLTRVRGFVVKGSAQCQVRSKTWQAEQQAVGNTCRAWEGSTKPLHPTDDGKNYVCHCEDVDLDCILQVVGDRKYFSVDELKHLTRMGMGPCRGKRCVPRARQVLRSYGIELVGDSTPRAPLASQVSLGDIYRPGSKEVFVFPAGMQVKKERVEVLVAGGGMAGSATFRYFSEVGKKTVLLNYDRGSSWRCIGGGRPAFSNPDISDIAMHNLEIFRNIQKKQNIDFKMTRYVNLVHDDATYRALDASRAWSEAYMIEKKDFRKEISPLWNMDTNIYSHALVSHDCWQATPGRTIEYVRMVAQQHGGRLMEDCELVSVERLGDGTFRTLVRTHDKQYIEFRCDHFVNAMGWNAEKFADMLDIDAQLYPVKHQAFITRRLPTLGVRNDSLDMIIDRRHYKGFGAVYGQQLLHTGQIIGCASPDCDAFEARQNLKYNSEAFLKVVSNVFALWIPDLAAVGFHAVWAGYYMEPRYIVDPAVGMLTGLRGHGFMLGQYLAKLYVDKHLGRPVPGYMKDLALSGQGLSESAFR